MAFHLPAAVNALKKRDPVMAISNLCHNEELSPELIAEAKGMLDFHQCGWLETPEQRAQTLKLCALVRTEWNSEEKQQPATVAARLLERCEADENALEEAALLLGLRLRGRARRCCAVC